MRWQYFTHVVDSTGVFRAGNVNPVQLTDIMNYYGNQGWELVNAFDTNAAGGGSRFIVLCFKRPIDAGAPVPVIPA